MVLRSLFSHALPVAFVAALLVAGCVEIPSEGHTPPDYKASVRVMYVDPAITASASINVAEGPSFGSFSTSIFPSGSFGTVTGYTTVNAGGKQLFLSPGDADTSALTIAADQRGTLLVLPRSSTADPRFLLNGEGRLFEPTGIEGSSRVQFINAITGGMADTTNIAVDVYRTSDSTTVVTNLAFGAASADVLVEEGVSEGFYLTRAGATGALGTAVTITGASNTDYTMVGSGSADAATLSSFRNE
ncbi:MAG: hypothetical protein OEV30_08745 [Ignavibacteria bacterium]|nr:hypothetical protein [Ignavibacteria bacterium]